MSLSDLSTQPSFKGITTIIATTDSHQETRKTSALLSEALRRAKGKKNVLFLNGGDFFKGVYPRELERDSFLIAKEAAPDIEMVTTVGNNDFGFNQNQLDFFIQSMRDFAKKKIQVVCANIFNTSGERPDWLKPYTIVERDGDRSLITGLCINNINSAKFGIVAKNRTEVLKEIADAVKREKPDNFIVLNHDFMLASQSLINELAKYLVKPDLILGGHEHEPIKPDIEHHIYYPEAFSNNMLIMNLKNNNGKTTISDLDIVPSDNLKIEPSFEKRIIEYEKTSGLTQNIAPRILNLTKKYSEPCPIGSFLADEMKKVSDSDIAFFSTGFLMSPLEYRKNDFINNYDFKKTICAENAIETVYLSADELKQVFQNSLATFGKPKPNAKFLQCSSNVRVIGTLNKATDIWEVKDIYIDDKPIESERQYKCCIDSYIANGGQGFSILQQKGKNAVEKNGITYTISNTLIEGLKNAPNNYKAGTEYSAFEIKTV